MFRLLINVALAILLIRLLSPVFRTVGKMFSGEKRSSQAARKDKGPYSDLTRYEIEDADYEEIKTEK